MAAKKIFDIYPPKKERETQPTPILGRKESSLRVVSKKERLTLSWKNLLWVVPLLLLLAGGFLHFSARAEIEIWPRVQSFSLQERVIVDAKASQADLKQKIIPGSVASQELEKEMSFSATGVGYKESNATGKITVFNKYHLSQSLVAGTRFVSADGKFFRSLSSINIPSGQSQEVKVKAAGPGPEYNIKATTFSIPGLLGSRRYTAVFGQSFKSMEGGATGQVSQVSSDDLQRAQEELKEELKKMFINKAREEKDFSSTFLDGAMDQEILEKKSSHQAGQEGENFSFWLKTKNKALIFNQTDLGALAEKLILTKDLEEKKISQESLKINPQLKKINWEQAQMILEVEITLGTVSQLDPEAIKASLGGKSLKASEAFLGSHEGIEKAVIRLFPFWISQVPENREKVEIKLKY